MGSIEGYFKENTMKGLLMFSLLLVGALAFPRNLTNGTGSGEEAETTGSGENYDYYGSEEYYDSTGSGENYEYGSEEYYDYGSEEGVNTTDVSEMTRNGTGSGEEGETTGSGENYDYYGSEEYYDNTGSG